MRLALNILFILMLRTRDNVYVPFITSAPQIPEHKFKFLSFKMQNWIMEVLYSLTYDSDVVNIEIFEL